ncbi:MAG: hypothetical protein H7Z42_12565, partial [Roseiflexaceae bacterium]|nr:hypothetical protein [Roseiflexaceae bacterium]
MGEAGVRTQYDQAAANYDRRWRRYLHDTLTLLHEWADITPPADVLDVACGTGLFEVHVLASDQGSGIRGQGSEPNSPALKRRDALRGELRIVGV